MPDRSDWQIPAPPGWRTDLPTISGSHAGTRATPVTLEVRVDAAPIVERLVIDGAATGVTTLALADVPVRLGQPLTSIATGDDRIGTYGRGRLGVTISTGRAKRVRADGVVPPQRVSVA